jgi:hypothetical protein
MPGWGGEGKKRRITSGHAISTAIDRMIATTIRFRSINSHQAELPPVQTNSSRAGRMVVDDRSIRRMIRQDYFTGS